MDGDHERAGDFRRNAAASTTSHRSTIVVLPKPRVRGFDRMFKTLRAVFERTSLEPSWNHQMAVYFGDWAVMAIQDAQWFTSLGKHQEAGGAASDAYRWARLAGHFGTLALSTRSPRI